MSTNSRSIARQILCNVVIEVGAKSGFVNPDEKACAYTRSVTDEPFEPVLSDPDADYALVLDFDVAFIGAATGGTAQSG